MLRSLYSGVSGMRGFQLKLDVIGNNIANVNTVGFKGSRVMFQDILSQTVSGVTAPEEGTKGGVNPKQVGLGSSTAAIDVIHTPGSGMTTNVTTDLRIDGDGFFAVSPDDGGATYLTRAGNFSRDAAGNLVTPEGFLVQAVGGGAINIPAEVNAFTISKDGSVIATNPDGTTSTIAQIGVVRVQNPGGLEKIGNTMFRMTQNANPGGEFEVAAPNDAATGTGALVSGQLEMSNVDLTSEFTEMIVAQRGFQANARIITTSDSILQEVIDLKR